MQEIAEWAVVAGQMEERRFQFRVSQGIATATLVSVTAQRTGHLVKVAAHWATCSAQVQPQLRLVEKHTKKKKVLGITVSGKTEYHTTYRPRALTAAEHEQILAHLLAKAELVLPRLTK
jgi:hypothetical protein